MAGQRRQAVEVQGQRLALARQVHEHRARAGDGGHERLDDRHGERGGDGGVDGIAAAGQDARADLGAAPVLRGNHPVTGKRRLLGDDQGRSDHGTSGD